MSTAEHEGLYRQVIEAISRGDADALGELLAEDVMDHNPLPGQPPGRNGFRWWMHAVRTSFPDFAGTIEDIVSAGDRVAGRVVWRGTQHGDFAGIAPTGRPVSFTAIHIVRVEEGRIAEWWGAANLIDALQQLGANISGPN